MRILNQMTLQNYSKSLTEYSNLETRRTHSAGTVWSMRREPIVENKHNTHALPDYLVRVQARETVHNLPGYKNKISKFSSWLYKTKQKNHTIF